MHVDVSDKKEAAVPAEPERASPDHVAVAAHEHRIYVWSSPAPYAVVVRESRSFHTS